MKNSIIKVYKNVNTKNPVILTMFSLFALVSLVMLVIMILEKEEQLAYLVPISGILLSGYLLINMYYWQKLIITSENIEVYGAPANDKKVPIKDIDYFTVIPNWPKPQMIYFDIHGKKRAWDISYFFGRKSEVKEFIKTLQEINPKVQDKIDYDSMLLKVLWSDR